MALGRQGVVHDASLIGWHEMPGPPGHVFHGRLNAVLEVDALCRPHYASG